MTHTSAPADGNLLPLSDSSPKFTVTCTASMSSSSFAGPSNFSLNPSNFDPASFSLFSFPRELRDQIYYHYLYRSHCIINYRRQTRCQNMRPTHKTLPIFPIELLLVSKQVHKEALQIFCRYNQVLIDYKNHLDHELRLWPGSLTAQIQRVTLSYSQPYYYTSSQRKRPGPSGTYASMIQDAYALKSYFPALREFTAGWTIMHLSEFEMYEGFSFVGKTEKECEELWLWWLKRCYKMDGLVPPEWLRVEFARHEYLEGTFIAAFEKLRKSLVGKMREREEVEDSGRKWLEEIWGEGKEKRKGKNGSKNIKNARSVDIRKDENPDRLI